MTELTWLRVSCGAEPKPFCFAVAVDRGHVVSGAPLGMFFARKVGYNEEKFIRFMLWKKATIIRMNP